MEFKLLSNSECNGILVFSIISLSFVVLFKNVCGKTVNIEVYSTRGIPTSYTSL